MYLCSLRFVCTCVLWGSCVLVFSEVRVYLCSLRFVFSEVRVYLCSLRFVCTCVL